MSLRQKIRSLLKWKAKVKEVRESGPEASKRFYIRPRLAAALHIAAKGFGKIGAHIGGAGA